jgi:autotransporter translocation and assembly factor TamB
MSALKISVDQAKAKAKTDCAGGVSGDQARTALKTSMEQAMQTFRTTVQSIEKSKDITQEEKDARKTEIDAIETAFKKSTSQARNYLNSALRLVAATSTTNQ